jgi:DNA-binding NtrC family response regulator
MKIMIVDDEPMILTVLKRMLSKLGHEAITYESEFEALDYYSKNSNNVDLVILDIKLKKLTGKEIFERIREINTKQKVIIITGYGFTTEIQELMKNGLSGFMEKPFGLEDLKSALVKIS